MCVVKTPKIKSNPAEDNKPLPVLHSPLLDGIDPMTNALRIGRNNLRLDRAPTAATAPSNLRISGAGG